MVRARGVLRLDDQLAGRDGRAHADLRAPVDHRRAQRARGPLPMNKMGLQQDAVRGDLLTAQEHLPGSSGAGRPTRAREQVAQRERRRARRRPRPQEAARPVLLEDRMSAFSRACRHRNPMTDEDHCVRAAKSSAWRRARRRVASSAQVRSSSRSRTSCDAWAELLMTRLAAWFSSRAACSLDRLRARAWWAAH